MFVVLKGLLMELVFGLLLWQALLLSVLPSLWMLRVCFCARLEIKYMEIKGSVCLCGYGDGKQRVEMKTQQSHPEVTAIWI